MNHLLQPFCNRGNDERHGSNALVKVHKMDETRALKPGRPSCASTAYLQHAEINAHAQRAGKTKRLLIL